LACGHFVIALAATRNALKQAAVGECFMVGDDDLRQCVFAGRQGNDMSALDEPDFGVVSASADPLSGENLEELGVKGPLVQEKGKPSAPSLFGSAAHIASMHFPSQSFGTL